MDEPTDPRLAAIAQLLTRKSGQQLPAFQMPGSQPLAATPPTNNLLAADGDMQLTPQERALYARHLENLYGNGGVDNPDGSRSTLYTMNVGVGDKAYNLPTVYDGQILSPESALTRARAQGLDGFPSYASPFAAENRYTRMHNYMDRDTAEYMASKGRR